MSFTSSRNHILHLSQPWQKLRQGIPYISAGSVVRPHKLNAVPIRIPIAIILGAHRRSYATRRGDPFSVSRPNRFRAPTPYPFGLAFGLAGSLILGAVVLSPVLLLTVTGALGIAAWRLSRRLLRPPSYPTPNSQVTDSTPPFVDAVFRLLGGILPSVLSRPESENALFRSASSLLQNDPNLSRQISSILGSPSLHLYPPHLTEKNLVVVNGISRNTVTIYFPARSPSGQKSTVMAVGTVEPTSSKMETSFNDVKITQLVLITPDGIEHPLQLGSQPSSRPTAFEGEYREVRK